MVTTAYNIKFLPINKEVGDSGQIELNKSTSWCADGNMYASVYYGFKKILCTTSDATYVNDIVHINPEHKKIVSFSPNRIFPKPKLIIASSKTEPVALYYEVEQNHITLYLYNFENFQQQKLLDYRLLSTLSLSDINAQIRSCNILFSAISNSKQLDLFLDCQMLGLKRTFLLQNNYNQPSDLLPLTLCNSDIKFGDFNGDKLSDILCFENHPKIILNSDKFFLLDDKSNIIAIELRKETYNEWAQHFSNPNSVYLGDFDGDSLTDILSITDKPKILFGDINNVFVSHNINVNGKFSINTLDDWCSNAALNSLLISDYNNDNKDDILCKKGGNTYLMFSYAKPSPSGINKIQVSIGDFLLSSDNLSYDVTRKTVPYSCNAGNIQDPEAYITCSFKNQNAIRNLNIPIKTSSLYPNIDITTSIKSQFTIAPNDSLIPKTINSNYNLEYIRGRLASQTIENLEEIHKFQIPAASCKTIEGEYVTLKKGYTATVRVKIFDKNGKVVKNSAIPQNLFSLYDFSFNPSGTEASFKITGNLEIETIHSFVSKRCDDSYNYKIEDECVGEFFCQTKVNIGRHLLQNTQTLTNACEVSGVISPLFQKLATETLLGNIQSRLVEVKRDDALDMHGYVYNQTDFFPHELVGSNSILTKHNPEHEDLQQSAIFYTNNYKIISTINSDQSLCPRMSIKIQFLHSTTVIKKIIYAGFDSIRAVKIEPLVEQSLVVVWSLFFYPEQKFLILIDYVKGNTQNDFYRVSSYDGKFSTLGINNEFFLSYRIDQNHLEIIKFDGASNKLSNINVTTLDFLSEHQLDFRLVANDDGTFSLFWSFINNKGIFFQKFYTNLTKIEPEKNIICFPGHFSVDTYGMNAVVLWQELSQLSLERRYFIQTINNNTFTLRKNVFNVIGARVEDISILDLHEQESNSNLELSAERLGYVVLLQNGTDHLISIYNSTLDLEKFFLLGSSEGEGLAMTLEALTYSDNSDIADIHNQISSDKRVLSNLAQAGNAVVNTLSTIIATSAVLSSIASTSEECNCDCLLEEKPTEVKYNSGEIENAAQELEIIQSEVEIAEKELFKKTSRFFIKIAEKLSIIRNRLKSEVGFLLERTGFKAMQEVLASEVKVLGKAIPVIDIIFGAVFLAEEIISIKQESGVVSTMALRLNYPSKSKVDGANLDQIEDLEAVLNFIYPGIAKTLPFIEHIEAIPKFNEFKNKIFCKNTVTNTEIDDIISKLVKLLQSDLYFRFHTSGDDTCSTNKALYSVFRRGSEIHFCSNYDDVDRDKVCRIFIKILRDTAEFLLPFLLAPLFTNPITAIVATIIVGLIMSDALSDEHVAEFCHIFSCMISNNPLDIAVEILRKIHNSNIESELSAEFRGEIINIQRQINELFEDLKNSDGVLNKAGDIFAIFEILITKIFTGTGTGIGSWVYGKFNDVCHEHYSIDHTKLLHLSSILIAGLISQEQVREIDADNCNTMVERCCNNPGDRVDNFYCLPRFVIATASAFNTSETFKAITNNDLAYLCANGCEMSSTDLTALIAILGGYYD